MRVNANGISIEVEDTGADGSQAGRPVVMLIMGLGMQLVAWPQALVDTLVQAGYRVVRHDNRDIGLSQHFDALGVPNMLWAMFKSRVGMALRPPYTLEDMAHDALGVLDALGIPSAHIVGASMGGMIAQRVAIAAPSRVRTLTSIMSSSGARGLPEAKAEVVRALMSRPAGRNREAILDHGVKVFRLIGSPAYPSTDAEIKQRMGLALDRSYHPVGVLRQMVAIGADTGRANALARINSPSLVLHGRADALVPFPCGEDTARRIPASRLVGIDGMGHDLPPGVLEQLIPHMLPHMAAH
jgi:pimeloyl-ACP methyl ester carboxylesterase